jgi:cell division protein FtsQ
MERLIDARGPRLRIAWPRRGRTSLWVALGRLVRRRTVRRRALALLAVLALLVLGFFGLRNSPLVAVTHVRVSGVHGLYAAQISTALAVAARRQSTMVVDLRKLRAAVAQFGVVRDLRVSSGFPHTLRIGVIEQLPVATLTAAGQRAAVAGDGTVLGAGVSSVGTPQISVPAVPYRHVSDPQLLSELEALAPAPEPLLRRVGRILFGPQGLTIVMRNGLPLYFGDSSLARDKWIAAALVIGDPGSVGATYIDVRLPDRPAAGGLTRASGTSASGTVAATQASLVATLATALANSASGATGAAGPGPASAPGGPGAAPAGAAAVPRP